MDDLGVPPFQETSKYSFASFPSISHFHLPELDNGKIETGHPNNETHGSTKSSQFIGEVSHWWLGGLWWFKFFQTLA